MKCHAEQCTYLLSREQRWTQVLRSSTFNQHKSQEEKLQDHNYPPKKESTKERPLSSIFLKI